MTIKREAWGYSLWAREIRDGKRLYVQVGAGVGLDPFAFHRAPQTVTEKRIWRKHGILKLS